MEFLELPMGLVTKAGWMGSYLRVCIKDYEGWISLSTGTHASYHCDFIFAL